MMIRWTDVRPNTNTNPALSLFDAFQREFDRAADGWENLFNVHHLGEAGRRVPPVNLYDQDEKLLLIAEVPGFSLEDLEIEANAEGLTLSGKRSFEAPEGFELRHQEREQIEFQRSIHWPVQVDVDQIEATLKDGMLQVSIAKAPEARPRNIEIELR